MFTRYCILLSFIFLSTYALGLEGEKRKAPVDHGMEHPDHIPHHDGKVPIKKVTQDELVFSRKRKKLHHSVVS